MAAIAAGLNSAPIARLKRTKEMLTQKTMTQKADLDSTLDSTKNFSKYKDMLKTINPPCVPFFGMPSVKHVRLADQLLQAFGSPRSLLSKTGTKMSCRLHRATAWSTQSLRPRCHLLHRDPYIPDNHSSISSNGHCLPRSSEIYSNTSLSLTTSLAVRLYTISSCVASTERISVETMCTRLVSG